MQGEITQEEQIKLQSLFNELMQSKIVGRFYSRDYKVLNEKAILVPQQRVLRPDRVGVGNNDAYVIDYKTGKQKPDHVHQVKAYAAWIEKITQKRVNTFLVYLNISAVKPLIILQLS